MHNALDSLIGKSQNFRAVVEKLRLIAESETTVLISGETGTGKQIVAKAMHALSGRASGPFSIFDCGAVPVELLENELFGHAEGAYTGAGSAQVGIVPACDTGTLLIDEIDALPFVAQVKLLRLLEDREFRPLGHSKHIPANVRILAATNASLPSLVGQGKFRQDLYHRLNVISLELPPLRNRTEDIPLLADHFLRRSCERLGKKIDGISSEGMLQLMLYNWPGNVRELEHVIERAVLFCIGDVIATSEIDLMNDEKQEPKGYLESKMEAIDRFERDFLLNVLFAHNGNVSRAAVAAKTDRKVIRSLMKKHGIGPVGGNNGFSGGDE